LSLRRLRAGLVFPLALAACGPAPASSDPPRARAPSSGGGAEAPSDTPSLRGREPDRDEADALREAMRVAERLRDLRFARPVPVRVQSRADITDFVRSRIDDREIEDARTFYVALGLLSADADVRALVTRVMGEQIAGFYDPRSHTMVVRDDVIADLARLVARGGSILGSQNAMVLVHEYVHALQDQRLGLREGDERTIDEDNAWASVVEGDASLTMLGVGLAGTGRTLSDLTRVPGLLRGQLAAAGERGPEGSELASAPPILRAPLMSRYLDGLVFAGALHGRGGFRAVDAAFQSPPRTTEQVLHPARYLADERPEPISLPALDAMAAAGFRALDEETLGELEISVYFAQGTAADRDRVAAEGWDGDRIRVYHRPGADGSAGASAFVWFLAWDDVREAIEAEAAARRVAASASPGAAGPALVRRIDRALAIHAGLDPTAAADAERAFEVFARTLVAH
jgi:hypothetical protein